MEERKGKYKRRGTRGIVKQRRRSKIKRRERYNLGGKRRNYKRKKTANSEELRC